MKTQFNTKAVAVWLSLSLFVLAFAGASLAANKTSDETAWLGVQLQALNDDLKEAMDMDEDADGVLIAEVVDDSPADKAGLEDGDVVTALDGEEVTSVKFLVGAIKDRSPGDRVKLEVLRDGRRKTFEVELGESDVERQIKRIRIPDVSHLEKLGEHANQWVQTWDVERGYLGVKIIDLNDDLGEYFKVKDGGGVLITEVLEDSPAEDAGLLAGDVVLEFDGKTVKSTDKFRKYVAEADPGEDVALVVKRKGRKKTVEVEIGQMESPMGNFMQGFMRPGCGKKGTGGRIVIKGDDGEVEIIDLPGGTGMYSRKPHSGGPGVRTHKILIDDLEDLDDLEEFEGLLELEGLHKIEGLYELEELEEEMEDLQKEMQELRRELEKLKK